MSPPIQITGAVLVDGTPEAGRDTFAAINPATGQSIGPPFQQAHAGDVAHACELAARARFLQMAGGEIQGAEQQAGLFAVEASRFMTDAALRREVFGPSSLLVRARDVGQMAQVIEMLAGQLTASIFFDKEDVPLVAELLPRLERKVSRIIGNGWPTGVEVYHAMVHGGPFPATTDVRTTSVGSLAIQRFLRPVCYQNLPDELLPEALRDENPLALSRRIDGVVRVPRAAS
jgi:NADP-dependent aldehyde dehydrogenase